MPQFYVKVGLKHLHRPYFYENLTLPEAQAKKIEQMNKGRTATIHKCKEGVKCFGQ